MKRELGVGYCGLACCLCSENANCAGCRGDGCKDKQWCKNYKCCKEKRIRGCWECKNFPCKGGMLDNVRIQAFAEFIREYGEEKLLDCLAINEQKGIVYHKEGTLKGDYDLPKTKDGIFDMILGEKSKEK